MQPHHHETWFEGRNFHHEKDRSMVDLFHLIYGLMPDRQVENRGERLNNYIKLEQKLNSLEVGMPLMAISDDIVSCAGIVCKSNKQNRLYRYAMRRKIYDAYINIVTSIDVPLRPATLNIYKPTTLRVVPRHPAAPVWETLANIECRVQGNAYTTFRRLYLSDPIASLDLKSGPHEIGQLVDSPYYTSHVRHIAENLLNRYRPFPDPPESAPFNDVA